MLGITQRNKASARTTSEHGAAAPPAGRRREALLRQHADRARMQRLSVSDVGLLKQHPSAENRAAIATKFGHQFDELAQGPGRDLALSVLQLLVKDVAREVRESLAQAVAASPSLPVAEAIQLAGDEIEVAGPILERSPALSDEELIRIIRTSNAQYALAVAGRERLSEAVGAALVATSRQPVVLRLAGNAGAALSRETLHTILEDHHGDREIEDRLVRYPELPHEIIEELLGLLGDRLEWPMVRSREMSAEQARLVTTAVRERAKIAVNAREHSDRQAFQRLRERFDAGNVTHDDLLRYLRQGDIASLELGLSMHARLQPVEMRRLFYNPDRRYMAALCIQAGFAVPHYILLRMVLDFAEGVAGPTGKPPSYGAETIRFLQVQYERLRRDEVKLRELLQG